MLILFNNFPSLQTLLTENAQLRNEVQQLRQQLIEMNVNKMNVDNNNMKEIHA